VEDHHLEAASAARVDHRVVKISKLLQTSHLKKRFLGVRQPLQHALQFAVRTAKVLVQKLEHRRQRAVNATVQDKFDEFAKACSAKW
jgi:hypothetical protein